MFQYVAPGMIIWLIWNRCVIESITWVAPPRRTATTPTPILPAKSPPFAMATKPARSISALISGVTSAKYVGEPSTMASATTILAKISLNASPSKTHF